MGWKACKIRKVQEISPQIPIYLLHFIIFYPITLFLDCQRAAFRLPFSLLTLSITGCNRSLRSSRLCRSFSAFSARFSASSLSLTACSLSSFKSWILWKLSVWNYNIIVIQNVLNRSKAGKKITPVNNKHSQEFFLAPFWHRKPYFSILNLSVFHLADKYFTVSNLINLRTILFLEYRKTPETLRFRGILRLDTMYLAVLNIY